MKNWLKDLIESTLYDRSEIYRYMSKEQSRVELRTLYAIAPRQIGSTTCIAGIFDPSQDIYFSNNPAMIKRFREITGYRTFMYSYLNQKSHNALRGRNQYIRYIFIDLSNIENMYNLDTQEKIHNFINFCESSFSNPKYIFT